MDWMSILNQCLDIILPAIASVVAVLFGVLGTKIKQIYNEKVQDETVRTVVDNVVKWAQQTFEQTQGPEKLQAALEKASTILNEKGITISDTELNMLIESAVYGLKNGTTDTLLVEGTVEKTTPEAIETIEDAEKITQ